MHIAPQWNGVGLMTSDSEWLDIAQAAALLRVSEASLRRWTNGGRLPCRRSGGRRGGRLPAGPLNVVLGGRADGAPGGQLCGLSGGDLGGAPQGAILHG